MRPVFMSAVVILVHLAIKSYDLVIALTSGGPGTSSDMPAVFMTQYAFHRSEIGLAFFQCDYDVFNGYGNCYSLFVF